MSWGSYSGLPACADARAGGVSVTIHPFSSIYAIQGGKGGAHPGQVGDLSQGQHTKTIYLESPINLTRMSLYCGRKLRGPSDNPHRQWENM